MPFKPLNVKLAIPSANVLCPGPRHVKAFSPYPALSFHFEWKYLIGSQMDHSEWKGAVTQSANPTTTRRQWPPADDTPDAPWNGQTTEPESETATAEYTGRPVVPS